MAYHGLVDLRLASATRFWSSITEKEFIRILEASPGLQTLSFALEITNPSPDNTPVMPVVLSDLEELEVSTLQQCGPTLQLGSILRLIAPGSKPLRLRLQDIPQEGPQLKMVQGFFKRSNLERLYVATAYPPMKELLSYIPNLTALVYDQCYDPENLDLPNPPSDNSIHNFFWELWEMKDCVLALSDFHSIIQQYPNGKPLLAGCDISRRSGEKVPDEELLATFPTVDFTDLDNDPFLPHRWVPLD
ncbi:hypothetical protein B0J17DRAFT_715090 [Rhizoctonia solani]|nr:hypothetical protein B0J17DRAFT_715090 [Rhizoctonia solani]